MSKKHYSGFIRLLSVMTLLASCKPKAPNGYFQTPFQSECQFIVEAIASDLASQVYYAAKHEAPEKKHFLVTADEKPGSPSDTPAYDLVIDLDQHHKGLRYELNVNGPIWAPEVYRGLTATLAQAMNVAPAPNNEEGGSSFPSDLLDSTAESIEQEDSVVSSGLERSFTSPLLHEQAALLLGAFMLRDHSGHFFEIRSPLSRLTAHLAMAQFFSNADSFGVNGQLAEATMLTLTGDSAQALDELKSMQSADPNVAAMIRALQARNTGDFRPLTKMTGRSPMESVAWFEAMADYASPAEAWQKLDDTQRATIDFIRTANDIGYSVQMGHDLLHAVPLEIQEIQSIYKLSHGQKLEDARLVEALNQAPEDCFTEASGGKAHVRVIGWGQWADFFQRQLCYAIQQNFHFMQWSWGVPDDARKFADQCQQQFGGLRLYPFVRRFNAINVDSYHKAVDDGFAVTVATPHLVPAECWNYLCYTVNFAPPYTPNPNPHVNEWHSHNPPPGTVYDLRPRLYDPSLIDRPDVNARLEQLHAWSPYDLRIANEIVRREYAGHPTYEQAMALYGDALPWSVNAVQSVAATVKGDFGQYERIMLPAAQLDPSVYYQLADAASNSGQEDKAAGYLDKACALDADVVRASNYAERRVRYYLKKGQTEKARQIADAGAEVYSSVGLTAEAVFQEATSNYDAAFEWYAKEEDRYGNPSQLVAFCQRYKALTGDTRFDDELKKRIGQIFPNGMEKVSLSHFHSAPTDGVAVQQQNDLLQEAGMKRGDVIVAIQGVHVHNFQQYTYIRDSLENPEMTLIVWQDGSFREITASPPSHRFGVEFGDYTSQ